MAKITDTAIEDRTAAMRRLSDDDRRAAIEAASNVIGFNRFSAVAKQRHLAEGYRAPRGSDAN